ncbi:MAG: tetratricopeptide repeat protein [Balneolaceae bacterium]
MKLLIFFAWIWLTGPADNTAREANRAYEEGDYPRAVQLYREALRETPDAPRIWFNLGSALAKSGEPDAAIEAFDRAHDLFETSGDRARTRYNAGHIMSGLEQYEEAVRLFRESLQEDPEDVDARHNYELAKRRLESSQNEESNPEESDQGDSNDEDQEQESGQNPPPGHQPPPNDQQSGGSPPPSQMSPEEAQSLLDALQQQERELLEQRNRTSESGESNDANW